MGGARWRLRLLTALGLTGCAAMLVTVVWASRGRAPEDGRGAAGPLVHVGVAQGQSIPQYVSSSRHELKVMLAQRDAGVGETYALVSLRTYLAPDRLTPVLGGVAVAEVYARVPADEAQTQIVRIPAFRIPEDVVTGMLTVASRKEAEAGDFRLLAGKLRQIDATEERLRQNYLGGASVATLEASAYRSGCACVYAAVVRATPVALDQIAARPEVRAVDPAPEVMRIDQAVFLAPLPEQSYAARPAASRTVGSASPSPWSKRRLEGVR
jgi:hypothetical protein